VESHYLSSSIADEDGLDELLKHLGDSPWCEVLKVIRDGFNSLCGITLTRTSKVLLMNFGPAKKLTARVALA